MADTAERRPEARTGVQDGDHGGGNVSVMLQRRRDAALRLPPLACGCRDPLPCDLRGSCRPVAVWCCPGEFSANGQWQPHCRDTQ